MPASAASGGTNNLNFKTIEVDAQQHTVTFNYPGKSLVSELPMTGSAVLALDVRVLSNPSTCEGVRSCTAAYVKPVRAFFEAVE